VTIPSPEKDFDLAAVAAEMGMSERWVRQEIARHKPKHSRYGQKIRFTREQLDTFKAIFETNKVPTRKVTSGPRKKAS